MKYKSLLIRIPQGLHDALTRLRTQHHVNTSAWVCATLKSALEHEDMRIGTGATQSPEPAATPLPGWRPTAWTMATEMVFSKKIGCPMTNTRKWDGGGNCYYDI